MGIINKVTSLIASISVKYEIAKHNNRKDITKHIKSSLKRLNKEITDMLNENKESRV